MMNGYKGFRRKNIIEKLWLIIIDKKAYKKYRNLLNEYNKALKINAFISNGNALDLDRINAIAARNSSLNFVHSGNAGDIIYALPTIKKIQELIQKPVNLYLKLDQPNKLFLQFEHPLGIVMLNKNMAEMLVSLLSSQAYLYKCEIYSSQRIDIDLDNIRRAGLLLDRGNIAKWYGYLFGVNADLYKRWLEVKPNQDYADTIVIARSQRYRSPFVDYSFLSKYPKLLFIGVPTEFEEIKQQIPNIEYFTAVDFLQLAQVIAGCKFFVGNQSFPFSIAEGLKIPRLLEVFFNTPNVIPEGENAYDFYFQNHFESLVKQLVK